MEDRYLLVSLVDRRTCEVVRSWSIPYDGVADRREWVADFLCRRDWLLEDLSNEHRHRVTCFSGGTRMEVWGVQLEG